jgi:hypothetical protein
MHSGSFLNLRNTVDPGRKELPGVTGNLSICSGPKARFTKI